jgi:hypothetical protein
MKTAKTVKTAILTITLLILSTGIMLAHCDTMDGPLVKDARKALGQNNVNYVLKWVQPENENELKEAFHLTMKVRKLNSDAKALADQYFFETLVRIHRSGEGVPFTGVKPSGTPIDEKILAADRSIEIGNLTPLKGMVPEQMMPELEKRFTRVMSLRHYDENDVVAGRKYIASYVQFFKYAEGEEENHDAIHHESSSSSIHNH